jgi:membrane associated rhomboid family serine protease
MMNMTETVKQLLIINILFYIGANIVGDPAYTILSEYFPENPDFKFWQPLTAMFMHAQFKYGGIMHILFNMIALVSFGSLLERMWGGKKFLFFYISAGLGAAALHIGINYISFYKGLEILEASGFEKAQVLQILAEGKFSPQWEQLMTPSQYSSFMQAYFRPAVGASGAIYGLLVAFAMIAPNAELMLMFIPIPIKAKYFVPGLLAVDLFLGLKGNSIFGSGGSGIAHFAHIGGALVGFIMMWYWKKNSFNNKRWN